MEAAATAGDSSEEAMEASAAEARAVAVVAVAPLDVSGRWTRRETQSHSAIPKRTGSRLLRRRPHRSYR